ncbi:MAG TPA: response regulator transcription factor [Candidatus Dormibacteraeota bacterium]|nr:response regulator transcription factor [Candidatus Dormibacteraeota bacterium]
MSERPHVLVVDDDARIAAALKRALHYEGYSVEIAGDGTAALARAVTRPPDLVLLDVMLPGLDGVEVCRKLREGSDVPIMMLTARDATGERVRGLDSGADDYVLKPFTYEELLARVRALLRRAPHQRRRIVYAGVEVDLDAREVRRAGRLVQLTGTEFELLCHFVRNPRRVLSRDQILDAVWGYDFGATSNVVDVYVGYVRAKLGEPRLIHTVRGFGYVFRLEE